MTLKPSYNKYKSLKPPFPFAGAYTSTVLSKLRITLHRHKVQPLLKNSIQETYVSKSGLKLSVHVNYHESSSQTLFVLPGYLSHHNTSYMQSSLEMFFNSGWNVIRINPVDHGDSLSLNKEVFNAHQHHEVAECIEQYMKEPNHKYSLLGFSFGGNFALRIGCLNVGNKLDKVVSICPMVDHELSLDLMKSSFFKWYYRRKWLRTFKFKQKNWSDIDFSKVYKIKDFKEVTAALLPDILPQQLSLEEYFESYKITSAVIASLNVNATIIASKNDPVVPIVTFADLENNEKLNLIITDYGGHNGFIENYKFEDYSIKIAKQEFET